MSTLNVDTLANELGTGGPDFVGMPTVQGDPIVESGSNSDGTWTRWADGTQHVQTKVESISLEANDWASGTRRGAASFTWPLPFMGSPLGAYSSVDRGDTASNPLTSSRSIDEQGLVSTIINGGTQIITVYTSAMAIGRWK